MAREVGDRVLVTKGIWSDEHGIVVDRSTAKEHWVVEIDNSDSYRVSIGAECLEDETENDHRRRTYSVKMMSAEDRISYTEVKDFSRERAMRSVQEKIDASGQPGTVVDAVLIPL